MVDAQLLQSEIGDEVEDEDEDEDFDDEVEEFEEIRGDGVSFSNDQRVVAPPKGVTGNGEAGTRSPRFSVKYNSAVRRLISAICRMKLSFGDEMAKGSFCCRVSSPLLTVSH